MPQYKSEAHKQKMQQLLKQGKISKATLDEYEKGSKGKALPKRVTPKK